MRVGPNPGPVPAVRRVGSADDQRPVGAQDRTEPLLQTVIRSERRRFGLAPRELDEPEGAGVVPGEKRCCCWKCGDIPGCALRMCRLVPEIVRKLSARHLIGATQ